MYFIIIGIGTFILNNGITASSIHIGKYKTNGETKMVSCITNNLIFTCSTVIYMLFVMNKFTVSNRTDTFSMTFSFCCFCKNVYNVHHAAKCNTPAPATTAYMSMFCKILKLSSCLVTHLTLLPFFNTKLTRIYMYITKPNINL